MLYFFGRVVVVIFLIVFIVCVEVYFVVGFVWIVVEV